MMQTTGEVKTRLVMGMTTTMVNPTNLWETKATSSNTKLRRMMKALIWPVATYDCEAWRLEKEGDASGLSRT